MSPNGLNGAAGAGRDHDVDAASDIELRAVAPDGEHHRAHHQRRGQAVDDRRQAEREHAGGPEQRSGSSMPARSKAARAAPRTWRCRSSRHRRSSPRAGTAAYRRTPAGGCAHGPVQSASDMPHGARRRRKARMSPRSGPRPSSPCCDSATRANSRHQQHAGRRRRSDGRHSPANPRSGPAPTPCAHAASWRQQAGETSSGQAETTRHGARYALRHGPPA